MKAQNEILFVSSYPPRECGIATYTQDLLYAIKEKFGDSFSLKVCALESKYAYNLYPEEVTHILNTSKYLHYKDVVEKINADKTIRLVFIQHEFGLFEDAQGDLIYFLTALKKPVSITFHTVLPEPDWKRKQMVKSIVRIARSVVVMTNNSAEILQNDYEVDPKKISVIPHGTHLVADIDRNAIKVKYNLEKKNILSTFGLLSSGKSIETALDALPAIIEKFPNTMYCIVGKTHPGVVKNEGEKYREFLKKKTTQLGIEKNVLFINKYLSLTELLEILQITDIYFFTSKDPNQAVSGTLSYAMGSSCTIISTPIPHAKEMLQEGAGIIVDFQDPLQLAQSTINLLTDPELRQNITLNARHKIELTCWQNSAIAHARLFARDIGNDFSLNYKIPKISLDHIKRLSKKYGIVQFAKIFTSDLESGYTLDDNARALIALSKYYQINEDRSLLPLINTYLNFIEFVQQKNGTFLNHVDKNGQYHKQNEEINMEDCTGRAIWALGEFMECSKATSIKNYKRAEIVLNNVLVHINDLISPRAIAFTIKGLYYYNRTKQSQEITNIITRLADNLISKYKGVSDDNWKWFENYLTYANSILPEALLYAYLSTGNPLFKTIAKSSFDFLLSLTFTDNKIVVISNNGWYKKGQEANSFGEQPIDVAYTILSLDIFYETFGDKEYLQKIETAFSWFSGNNHLHRIIYNPITGGCQDGLEEHNVNLNQGAESSVCYLLARLTMEKYIRFAEIRSNELVFEPLVSERQKKMGLTKAINNPLNVYPLFRRN